MRHKINRLLVLMLFLSAFSGFGCQSLGLSPKVGMTKNQWAWRTLVGDLVTAQDGWEVWKSGGAFYYFKDGRLDHIDQGQLMQQRFQLEVIHKTE